MNSKAEYFEREERASSFSSALSVAAASFPANVPVTLDDCAAEYLLYIQTVRGLSENCVTAYREDLSHLSRVVGGTTKITEVTAADLRMSIAELSRRKYSSASINHLNLISIK